MNTNPLDNIKITPDSTYVMKGGKLYDAMTLHQIWPKAVPFGPTYWVNDDVLQQKHEVGDDIRQAAEEALTADHRGELFHRNGVDGLRIARDDSTVIVDLAEVVAEMRVEVNEPLSGWDCCAVDGLRKRFCQVRIRESIEGGVERASRRIDLRENLVTTYTAARELEVAIADVPSSAELRANEVLEIPAEMQREIAGGIRDAPA